MQNEQPVRCVIVDDEEDARKVLERLLQRISGIEVCGRAASVDEALPLILSLGPDLVFLDVQMPGKNGFALLENMRHLPFKPVVVFVTAHIEYAINAMKAAAFDYLLKPVNFDELAETMNRFRAEKWKNDYQDKINLLLNNLSRPGKLSFSTRTGTLFIDPEDIVYCEADVNYTYFYLGQGRKETVTVNLGKVEEMLQLHGFRRISRSHIIQLKYLSKADRRSGTCELFYLGEKFVISIPPGQVKAIENLIEGRG